MALVEPLGDDIVVGRWYVQLAAIWHWYFNSIPFKNFNHPTRGNFVDSSAPSTNTFPLV